jgi:hypothetical protein
VERAVVIKSAHDGTTLEFSANSPGYYGACLCGPNFRGTAIVYAHETAECSLARFFRELAVHWKGWPGKKEWRSLEGELSLAATIDSTGHISLSVRLRSGPYPFDWGLSAVLLMEAGQLEQIASLIERFVLDTAAAHGVSNTKAAQ